MRSSKFVGGSKLVSFRLPLVGLDDVKAKIKALIDGYELNGSIIHKEAVNAVDNPINVKERPKEKVLIKVDKVKPIVDTVSTNDNSYSCGCEYVGTLFVRSKGCKLARELHKGM